MKIPGGIAHGLSTADWGGREVRRLELGGVVYSRWKFEVDQCPPLEFFTCLDTESDVLALLDAG